MNEATTPSSDGPYQSPTGAGNLAADELPVAPETTSLRPLRIWPPILLLIVLWTARIVPRFLAESSGTVLMTWFFLPMGCIALILLWWLFLSRALIRERLLGLVGLIAIIVVTAAFADKSVRGFGTIIFGLPWGVTAFAVSLVALSRASPRWRTSLALIAALVGFAYWDLVRTDAIRADFTTTHNWRWEPTAEDRFLATLDARETETDAEQLSVEVLASAPWPAFRGPDRNGVQPGITLAEDWQTTKPREVWRIPIGPGWSSFSVAGDRLYTQEQRGDQEAVVCYSAETGQQIWSHESESRFWEVVGGAGPRATPTLDGDGLYTLGANGLLHRLDPNSGAVLWKRDLQADAGRAPPAWGFSSSPLVTQDVVIVHAGGDEDKGLLAYDAQTGEPRWSVADGDHSYSSPQLARVDGLECVMMLTNKGLLIVDPANGQVLGNHAWEFQGYRVVQPLMIGPRSVLLGTPMGTGTRRLELAKDGDQITVTESWTSRRMNPYFNDYVAHDGHLYGFDNNIFACIDLESGQRKWKQGRYGNGQVVLLPDNDQLLVLSEDGELVLLRATPDEHLELAKLQVLEGRTWNHPVIIGNRVYVRNASEAACFELPLATNASASTAEVPSE